MDHEWLDRAGGGGGFMNGCIGGGEGCVIIDWIG